MHAAQGPREESAGGKDEPLGGKEADGAVGESKPWG